MLSINTIARVAVNVVRSASQPNTGALLVKGFLLCRGQASPVVRQFDGSRRPDRRMPERG